MDIILIGVKFKLAIKIIKQTMWMASKKSVRCVVLSVSVLTTNNCDDHGVSFTNALQVRCGDPYCLGCCDFRLQGRQEVHVEEKKTGGLFIFFVIALLALIVSCIFL